jgi:serralysin
MTGIEQIALVSALDTRYGASGQTFDYDLTMNDANVVGIQMTIDAAALRSNETLAFNGSAEDDGSFRVFGGAGNDVIQGSQNGDIIVGRERGDTLYGNGGNDVFRYDSVADSNSNERDGIQDFNPGDLIDLSRIDSNVLADGDQAFSFIGSAAFTNTAGELRFENISLGGPIWLVQGDVNGDGVSDFEVVLNIPVPDPITSGDFIL